MRLLPVYCVVLGIFMFVEPLQAAFLNFNFSFANDPGLSHPVSTESIAGTVTGIIEGLPVNGTSPASDVLIESFPSGMVNWAGPVPIDTATWINFAGTQGAPNTFTTSNGQIVAADFYAYDSTSSFIFQIDYNSDNSLILDLHAYDSMPPLNTIVDNEGGLGGVTFTPAPEPASLWLIGVVGIGGLLHRRRQHAPIMQNTNAAT